MGDPWGKGQQEISQAEHISPGKTGDNIEAKRVANYTWTGTGWERFTGMSATISTLNSTATPLGSNASFEGTFEDIKGFASIGILLKTDKDSAENGVSVEWSHDGVTVDRHSTTTIQGLPSNGYFFSIPRQAQYFRLSYTNGSVAQTSFVIQTLLNRTETGSSYIPVGAPIDPLFTATLVKSVITGQQPDGDFVNASADGLAFETFTPLGIAGVYTSAWVDTDQWRSLEVFIKSDEVSANDGIEIQFSDNIQTATPTVQATVTRTITQADVDRGFVIYRFPSALDGVRVIYTNNGAAQSNFYLALNLRAFAVESPQTTLDGELALSDVSLLNRSVITGLSTTGDAYSNLTIVPVTNDSATYYSLPVVSGARPSDIPGRVSVTKHIDNVTADTQIHTTTANKIFYLTDIICMLENDATTGAVAYIRDGTSAAGTIKMPIRVDAKQGSATKQTTFTHAFNEPLAFNAGVFYDEVNDLTTSITIVGYEE